MNFELCFFMITAGLTTPIAIVCWVALIKFVWISVNQ